ncbi:hypothetical protein C0044_34370, partial [Pseudomonas aeruginosa]
MRKDKKQIIGEEISDESIKLFLGVEPADDTPPSLHKLIKAYRGLALVGDQGDEVVALGVARIEIVAGLAEE